MFSIVGLLAGWLAGLRIPSRPSPLNIILLTPFVFRVDFFHIFLSAFLFQFFFFLFFCLNVIVRRVLFSFFVYVFLALVCVCVSF